MGEKAATYMMLRQSGNKHAALQMDIQSDYAKGIRNAYPADCPTLQRMFDNLSFSKTAGSQPSQGTAFAQHQQKGSKKKNKDATRDGPQNQVKTGNLTNLTLTYLPMTKQSGLTEPAPTVAFRAIHTLTATGYSEPT